MLTPEQEPQQTQPPEQTGPYVVVAADDTRLAQLRALYDTAKATADDAAEKLKVITDAIKLELAQSAPDEPRIELQVAGQRPMALTYIESWRLDSRALKAADPETYVRFAKKSGSWSLRLGGGQP